MAPPRRTTRSASRRSTPVSPAKRQPGSATSTPRRRTRSTGNQADEIQIQIPQSQASAVDGANRPLPNRPPPRSTRMRAPRNKLDVVYEEPAAHEGARPRVPFREIAVDKENDQSDDDSISSSSASSGASPRSSTYSQLDRLDRDDMLLGLGDLLHDSKEMLSLLLYPDDPQTVNVFCQHIYRGSTDQTGKRFRKLHRRFEESCAPYGKQLYIAPDLVFRKLANVRDLNLVPDHLWQYTAVFEMVNLALLLQALYSFQLVDDEAGKHLEFLSNHFPLPFDSKWRLTDTSATSTDADYVRPTVHLGLDLRTQFLIRSLKDKERVSKPTFDPELFLAGAFYDDDNVFWGFPRESEDSKLPDHFHMDFMRRISQIRGAFDTRDNERPMIDLDRLDMLYPWPEFLLSLTRWARERQATIAAKIDAFGGVARMQSELREDRLGELAIQGPTEGVEERQPEETAATEEQGIAAVPPKHPHPKQAPRDAMEEGIRRLKARMTLNASKKVEKSISSPTVTVEIRARTEDAAQTARTEDAARTARTDGEQTEDGQHKITPSQQTTRILTEVRRQEQVSNKENLGIPRAGRAAFIDRQAGAKRLSFEDTQPTAEAPGPARRRRRHVSDEEDDDEEDDFTTDERFPISLRPRKRARQRAEQDDALIATADDWPPAGIEIEQGQVDEDTQAAVDRQLTAEDHRAASSPVRSREPADAPDPGRLPPSTAPELTRVPVQELRPAASQPPARSRSRELFSIAPPLVSRRRVIEPRRPFSAAEEDRLISLIEKYGTSWAFLLQRDERHREGPLLQERSQVNLKDKARNLKMAYLRYVHPLFLPSGQTGGVVSFDQ